VSKIYYNVKCRTRSEALDWSVQGELRPSSTPEVSWEGKACLCRSSWPQGGGPGD